MPLLQPDVQRIAPESTDPDTGPAPEWIAAGTPQPLRSELESLLGADRVLTRALDLIRYASDARLQPPSEGGSLTCFASRFGAIRQ
jgi:D-lactate dehydrogenase